MPTRARNSMFYDKEQWNQGSWTSCIWEFVGCVWTKQSPMCISAHLGNSKHLWGSWRDKRWV